MAGARTFVMGDIHGCVEELDRLLDALAPTADDTVVCLGDYIDRGPSSKGVIDRLLRLQTEGPHCVYLKGNHEDMFLAFLGEPGNYGEAFLYNGGAATLQSYGLQGEMGTLSVAQLPAAHVEFLRALRLRYEHGDFLCVHAGIDPQRPLDAQREEDLLWIREPFILHRHPFLRTILYGHTPQRDVRLDLPYKIGLDTGLVYWNNLSCLELETKELFQIGRGAHSVVRRNLGAAFAHPHTSAAHRPEPSPDR